MGTKRLGFRATVIALGVGLGLGSTAVLASAPTDEPVGMSGVTAVTAEVRDLGQVGSVPYERVVGQLSGRVAATEAIVGLEQLPSDDAGFVSWTSEFEVIRPTDSAVVDVVVVEAENRGNPLMIQLFNRFLGGSGAPSVAEYPDGLGDAFLFDGHTAYARVQWQTEIAAGVPAEAQGIGLAILRDFGLMLRSGVTVDGADSTLGEYETAILTGWSQGAWTVNTLVAEGFNVDPADPDNGVFAGAIALAGAGNWLAINQLGDDGEPQDPYLRPDAHPLTAEEMLTRPSSDPLFVDIATYTDFYRLRAGTSEPGVDDPDGDSNEPYRRYDWPAAHGPSFFVTDELVFEQLACNDGAVVPLSPLDFRPYLRAVLANLVAQLAEPSDPSLLPPSVTFQLGAEPLDSPLFNGLPDTEVPVPVVDAVGQPVGGVRFADVIAPLGSLNPVSLPPVSTETINHLCGNIGGYSPFSGEALIARYGDVETYQSIIEAAVGELVAAGFVLEADADTVISDLVDRFTAATA